MRINLVDRDRNNDVTVVDLPSIPNPGDVISLDYHNLLVAQPHLPHGEQLGETEINILKQAQGDWVVVLPPIYHVVSSIRPSDPAFRYITLLVSRRSLP